MTLALPRALASVTAWLALSGCQSNVALPDALARVAHGGAPGCQVPPLAEYAGLKNVSALPDPFTLIDGTRVASASDWTCRRAELLAQVQKYELGRKPAAPRALRARVVDQQIMITAEENGKTISFAATITLPATGKAPYPAMIGVGGVTLNNDELLRQGVAIITFPNNDIGAQQNSSSRGIGKFYTLYGSDHPAGAMTA